MNKDKIKVKDIFGALKQLPKTISLIARVDKVSFCVVIMLSLISGVFPVITLILSQEMINSLVGDIMLKNTIVLLVIYVGASFVGEIISEINGYNQGKFQYLLQYRLNFMLMNKCTELSLEDFEESEMYDRIEKITREIAYRPYQIFLSIIRLFTSLITMFSSFILLFVWKPYISCILLIVPVISLLYYLKIGQQEFNIIWNRAKDERKTWYLSYLLTHDFSFKEISLLGLKDYLLNNYLQISNQFLNQNMEILKTKTVFNLIYESTMQLISFIIIGSSIMSAYVGEILVGNVMSYIRSVGLVQNNVQSVMANIYNIYNSSLYMEMLFEFLDYKSEKVKRDSTTKIYGAISNIEIRNLSFSYKNGTQALKNINLSLKRGEKIALVGPNGSGKSTLIKILAGLYDIEAGKVLINNVDLKNMNMKDYQSHISVLFQDFVKYELTLQENIGFGDIENMDLTRKMEQILDRLRADFLKNDRNYDFNMQLGNWFEDGRQLSQGQWQKIALARAYFREASIYILDEPNAALDTVSEREIFDKFFEMSKEKIGIYISHRLNATKMADVIVVMEQGEIVGIGKHEELLQSCPVYKTLYDAEIYEENGAKKNE